MKGRILRFLPLLLVASLAQPLTAEPGRVRLTLPPMVGAVPGVEMNLYLANVILAEPGAEFQFSIDCDVGQAGAVRWTLNASPEQIGEHSLTIRVSDKAGHLLAQGSTRVCVVPASAGQGRDVALLLVGDSLTHASVYPNEVARLLSQPGNPAWRMLGTHKPNWASATVAHEGYGGWTWQAFNARFDPAPPPPGKKTSSPFVFGGATEPAPKLDVGRYLAAHCGGRAPDYVTFLLGINDCFRLNADQPATLEHGITAMLGEADKLLAAFHAAAPRAELGVCLTTPPNIRDAAFVANYKGAHPRWNWRQVQHRVVERQIEHFGNRESQGIFLVPTELNLDVTAGYPGNNAVHPNEIGYRQIGASIYSWLKVRLAARDRSPSVVSPDIPKEGDLR